MRSREEILTDFDNPIDATPPVNELDSITDSIRERIKLEVALDVRELLVEVRSAIGECREELAEIKDNTAS